MGTNNISPGQIKEISRLFFIILALPVTPISPIDIHQISNGDLITLQLNEGVIYMGQIEDDDDALDKYKYV